MGSTFYNDNDTWSVRWLLSLQRVGLIPSGVTSSQSILDLEPRHVEGFRHVHLFAGIGGWPRALELAGWPADREVWTGSCPCQPFSSAGKRREEDDERHLWPEMLRLIRECRPAAVLGEQVASPPGRRWLAGVRADLEELGYAVGAADLPAACVGAPHIRQRLFWVADDHGSRKRSASERVSAGQCEPGEGGGLGNSHGQRLQRRTEPELGTEQPEKPAPRRADSLRPGETGFWSDFDLCHFTGPDAGKVRRIEPGTFPLADGVPARVARLRGLGNAIVPQVAAVFVRAFLESEEVVR